MKPNNTPRSKFNIVRDARDPDRVREIHVNLFDYSLTKEQADKFIATVDMLQYYMYNFYVKQWTVPKEICDRFVRFTGEDYQQLFDAYLDNNKDLLFFVLQQRAQKAMHYYIREVFFDDYKIIDIDIAVQQMQDKYTMVSADTLDICRGKPFNKICVLSLLDELDQELPETARKVIKDIEQEGPVKPDEEGKVILHGIVQTMLIAACNDELLIERFAKHRQNTAQDLCKEEQKKALELYAKKHFFAAYKDMYYGWNQALTVQIDQYAQSILPNFPLLNSSTKHKYKAKHFYAEAQEQYIVYCLHYIDEATKKDAYLLEDKDIYKDLTKKLFDIENYKYFLKKKLEHIYTDFCTERQRRLDLENQRKATPSRPTDTREGSVAPRMVESNKLTPLQEQKLQELEQKMLNRVKIDINYITRMLKKWWPIYVESLVEDMGQWYSQELLEELIGLLQWFNVEIRTKKDHVIEEIVTGNKALQNSPVSPKTTKWEVEQSLIYSTLEEVKADPSLLTSEKLVQIFKEMGYRFWNEKDFIKSADLHLGASDVRESLIGLLQRGEQSIWKRTSAVKGSTHERAKFKNRVMRIVKQWNTILRILLYNDYMNQINLHFTGTKKDFDKELGPRDREAAIAQYQPKSTEKEAKKKDYTQYTNEFTEEDGTQLSKGA